jgi:hypothetical protein
MQKLLQSFGILSIQKRTLASVAFLLLVSAKSGAQVNLDLNIDCRIYPHSPLCMGAYPDSKGNSAGHDDSGTPIATPQPTPEPTATPRPSESSNSSDDNNNKPVASPTPSPGTPPSTPNPQTPFSLSQMTNPLVSSAEYGQKGRDTLTALRLDPAGVAYVVFAPSASAALTCYKIENTHASNSYFIPDGGSGDPQAHVDFATFLNDKDLGKYDKINLSVVTSLSADYQNCSKSPIPTGALTCSFGGNTIQSGSFVTAYLAGSGATCTSEKRTCTNGVLSGSYAFSSCTTSGPAGKCSVPSQTLTAPLNTCQSVRVWNPIWFSNGDLCLSGPNGSDGLNGIVGFNYDITQALTTVTGIQQIKIQYNDTDNAHQGVPGYLNDSVTTTPSGSADSGYIWPNNAYKDFGVWMTYNGTNHSVHVESASRGWGDCSQYGALGCNASVSNNITVYFGTASCPITDGQCGTSKADFDPDLCKVPSDASLCADGTVVPVTSDTSFGLNSGITTTHYSWSCPGNNGGAAMACKLDCTPKNKNNQIN